MKRIIVIMLSLCLCAAIQAAMVAHYDFEGDLTDSAGTYDGIAVNGYTASYVSCGLAGGSFGHV